MRPQFPDWLYYVVQNLQWFVRRSPWFLIRVDHALFPLESMDE
jgi:hypothetical protein